MTDGLTPVLFTPDDGSISSTVAYEVLPYGFLLNKFVINPDGKTHDVVIGPYDITEVGSHRWVLESTAKYDLFKLAQEASQVPQSHHWTVNPDPKGHFSIHRDLYNLLI